MNDHLRVTTTTDPALIVDDPADITPEWISAVLRRGGLDVRIRTTRHEQIGMGQIGASYRIQLGYDGAPPPGAPASVVAKMATGSESQRQSISRGYVAEVGFYQHLAGRVRARIPYSWHSTISHDHTRFTLILEDLAPSVPGSQTAGCAPAQARDAVVNLAALHASYWNDELLATGADWIAPMGADAGALIDAAMRTCVGMFTERFGTALVPEDAETLHAVAEVILQWLLHHQSPYSLIHGDYRPDNLMFSPGGPGVTALDWQTVSVGHPCRDLAYFLACSLPTPDRQAHERALVETYHTELVRQGVTGFSLEECLAGYRIGMLQGPLITVLGCIGSTVKPSAEADAMFMSMAARTCQAIRDLATLDAIRE